MAAVERPLGAFGRMAERSAGKDSVTGHWEIAGIVLTNAFPTFPTAFRRRHRWMFEARIGRCTIGNKAASGTAIIDELGPEHMRTGFPIVYTSADSVFQIAAHEEIIPVPELYRICKIAYELAAEGRGVGRVIARPFVGQPGHFTRTANRHDYALPPSGTTLLDALTGAGPHRPRDWQDPGSVRRPRHHHGGSHDERRATAMDEIELAMRAVPGGLIFTNLVDFDTQYGHRNDRSRLRGEPRAIRLRLARLLPRLRERDLLVITADHGNDPTTPSTDHAREHVPLFVTGRA